MNDYIYIYIVMEIYTSIIMDMCAHTHAVSWLYYILHSAHYAKAQ